LSKTDRRAGDKTLARATIDSLLTPDLEPGKAYLIVIRGRSVGRMVELSESSSLIGRSIDCHLPIDDEAVSRQHARVDREGSDYVLHDLGSTNGLFVDNARVKRHVLRDGNRVQLGSATIIKFCFQDELEERFQRQLYESATRDALVGIYNRQYFLDALEAEFSLCFRNGIALSLLMIDIDHFKSVNDRFGHLTGDQALKQVAITVQRQLRAEDLLARYGGEEFSVMLRHAGPREANVAAERIRRAIEALTIEHGEVSFQITLSVGIGTFKDRNHLNAEALLRTADRYLYEAKRQGRNRVVSVLNASSSDAGAPGGEDDITTTALPASRDPEDTVRRGGARATRAIRALEATSTEGARPEEAGPRDAEAGSAAAADDSGDTTGEGEGSQQRKDSDRRRPRKPRSPRGE
jgi:diguanylate cyclase (GGDEF)-like protein